ncbi:MAG: hypothetical protein LH473_01500 [Chitinophagales bacterium]|nr:hypothetical protein [Chitinophagales bacterium]
MKPQIFISEVFRKDKWLFIFFTCFIALQIFMTYKGIETIPIFHWGMYSSIHPPLNEFDRKVIFLNDTELNLSDSKEIAPGYLFSILDYYQVLKTNDFHDPILKVIDKRFSTFPALKEIATRRLANDREAQNNFRNWLCNYLQCGREEKIEVIKIADQRLVWNGSQMQAIQITVIDSFKCNQ